MPLTILTCPICFSTFILGMTGIVCGCDQCWGIERNPVDHSIINDDECVEVEDTMTDMEKS